MVLLNDEVLCGAVWCLVVWYCMVLCGDNLG